jgi:multiple sugar transport system substrate-binding protein
MGSAPKGLPAGGNAVILTSGSEDPEQLAAAWTFIKFITSGPGAAVVAETTGYMPPNKAANALLVDFYENNPNKQTAVRQAGLLRDWIAYRGRSSRTIDGHHRPRWCWFECDAGGHRLGCRPRHCR